MRPGSLCIACDTPRTKPFPNGGDTKLVSPEISSRDVPRYPEYQDIGRDRAGKEDRMNLMTIAAMRVMANQSGSSMLTTIKSLLTGGCGFLGGGLIVFGAISLGMNIHNGASGNGAAIGSAVGTIVGGAVICAAAVYFNTLDVSWAS